MQSYHMTKMLSKFALAQIESAIFMFFLCVACINLGYRKIVHNMKKTHRRLCYDVYNFVLAPNVIRQKERPEKLKA